MVGIRRIEWISIVLAVCFLMVSCTEPTGALDGLRNEFEVELPLASRATINDDANVDTVYAKVFNAAREHLPSIDPAGITELTEANGKWSATIKLASPVSGEITFLVWAVDSAGKHLYAGDGTISVPGSTSIIVPTQADYSLGDLGPAGGYIFYDKGSYSDGWRYLEAARDGWSTAVEDPSSVMGYYRTTSEGANLLVNTGTGVGSGETNTTALVTAMLNTAYTQSTGTTTTASYAAKICAELSAGGYDDWFLPSKDELVAMYQVLHLDAEGGFSNDYYWSSSEYAGYTVYMWSHGFSNGLSTYYARFEEKRIRPIRAF